MEFDESLQQYVYSCDDLIFSWDEEPKGEDINIVKILSKNYKDNFDKIIDFMLPDLREMRENLVGIYSKLFCTSIINIVVINFNTG